MEGVVTDQLVAVPRFSACLGDHGGQVALVADGTEITYVELDERVRALAEHLGPQRRLVLVGTGNAVEPLVAYLAALRGGHPVLLAAGDNPDSMQALADVYDPDVVIAPGTRAEAGWELMECREGSAHKLSPDLALLLSTSGSTGSPKLVRLSHQNLDANADSIGAYLGITGDDRAITTLPMHYCYGLSIINSHLQQGARVVLSDHSVVDPCFWQLFRDVGATSLAGVPHTFGLLDRVGFDEMSLPTLRYVTQAGGRLAPDAVRRYAALGRRKGWRLFVMYGQTEATARMAYLPPELAQSHPHTIGVAIPGGSFSIENPDAEGVGELVYRGDNVMLGYAQRPADLAGGATIDALHTGDLARVTDAGLYEIVGRRSRFVKLYGLRVDLDQVEQTLAAHGVTVMCVGDDQRLVVTAEANGNDTSETLRRLVTDHVGLPRSCVAITTVDELPRLPNGKADYVALQRPVSQGDIPRSLDESGTDSDDPATAIRATFAYLLGKRPGDHESFVSLGGDSLSYVEMSIRLEKILGALPRDWHITPVGQLTPSGRRSRRLRHTETGIVLRALAIVLIVGTHVKLWHLPGGAHTLLGIAGYNFARFQLNGTPMRASIARVALPSMAWIGIVAATSSDFSWHHALLLRGIVGGPEARWAYWYVEALVAILVVLAALLAIPAVRRAERRRPFAFACLVVAAALTVRFDVIDLPALSHRIWRPHEVFWLFALGWAAARATTPTRRALVSALVVASVPGFFATMPRELLVTGGLLLLLWLPTVPLPRLVNAPVGAIAAASLHIYLTHWQVYPPLLQSHGPLAATIGSVLVGIAAWVAAQRLTTVIGARLRDDRQPDTDRSGHPGSDSTISVSREPLGAPIDTAAGALGHHEDDGAGLAGLHSG